MAPWSFLPTRRWDARWCPLDWLLALLGAALAVWLGARLPG